MNKLQLIKEITNYYPWSRAGLSRKWSHYIGGMADTGDWYFRKLIDAPKSELEKCLLELKEDWKPTPIKELTEEEKIQKSNMVNIGNNCIVSELTLNAYSKFVIDSEKRLFESLYKDEEVIK